MPVLFKENQIYQMNSVKFFSLYMKRRGYLLLAHFLRCNELHTHTLYVCTNADGMGLCSINSFDKFCGYKDDNEKFDYERKCLHLL